jgi:CubicO group peptidase (beta-lactamase class C family)
VIQERVKNLIDSAVESGEETGIQVAGVVDGSIVVNAVVPVTDPTPARPVSAQTFFFAASTSKGLTSAVAHALIARGHLDDDLRIAEVWPSSAPTGWTV